jgi:hypothetical protein
VPVINAIATAVLRLFLGPYVSQIFNTVHVKVDVIPNLNNDSRKALIQLTNDGVVQANNLTLVIDTPISLLAVALIFSSFTSSAFAFPRNPNFGNGNCTGSPSGKYTCCWREKVSGQILANKYCQTCTWNRDTKEYDSCTQKELQMVEQPPSPPQPSGPAAPLQGGGILEQPQSPSTKVNDNTNTQKGTQNNGGGQQQQLQGTTQTDDNNKPSLKDNAKPPKGAGGSGGSLELPSP